MTHHGGRPTPPGANRALAGGEDITVPLRQCGRRAARLSAGPLLKEKKFAAGVRQARFVKVDDHLKRKEQVAVEVSM